MLHMYFGQSDNLLTPFTTRAHKAYYLTIQIRENIAQSVEGISHCGLCRNNNCITEFMGSLLDLFLMTYVVIALQWFVRQ